MPTCHSLRTVPDHPEMFFCAHPALHARSNLVSAAVCKSCQLRTGPAPQRFRSVTFRPDGLCQRADIQLVVAHYRESLDWLERFRELSRIVYHKGGLGGENPLPNVGREAHTYLHHVVANYDRLAPVTVFLQGDPYAHVPDLDDKIWSLEQRLGYRDLSDHILVEDAHGEPVQPGLRLGEMYRELFGQPPPDFFVCHAAACFAVSRENVLRRPREFYERALELVVRRAQGPWEIERLWQYLFRTRAVTEGVVTAADARFFPDLQWFLLSYGRWCRYPVVVYDLGLYDDQRRWCLEQPGVAVLPMPTIYSPVEHIRQHSFWQGWLKPFYVYNAPFDRVLWIDADCTLVAPLNDAFRTIAEQPLVVRDGTIAVTENPPDLYRHLTIPDHVRTHGITLNAGVVGLCKIRDRALLNAWTYGVAWAALNPDKRGLSAWCDQGMLLWAAHRTGQTQFIERSLEWNWPVDCAQGRPPMARSASLLVAATAKGHSVLEEIRCRYPQAKIVHWLGVYKLARQLDAEIKRLFLHGLTSLT
jgi:Protein of unknown function (DUF3431)